MMNRPLSALILGAALAATAAGFPAAGAPATSLPHDPVARAASAAPVRAAFYYPWFPQTWHDNDHYSPSRGRYSNDDPAVLDAQFDDMAYAGLDAAISSWWGPSTVTDRRLEPALTAAEAHGLTVAPYYEREGGNADPSSAEVGSDLAYLRPLTSRPGWLKRNGKPVIFVYNAGATGCGDVSRWKAATHDWADFYVNMKVFPGFADCPDQPDAWHQYGPATSRQVHLPWSFNVSPGFWHHQEAAPRLARDLTRFTGDLEDQVASGAEWQLVTSYSEWGEGTPVESAVEWSSPSGRGDYLDAMRRVFLGEAAGSTASVGGGGLRVPAFADATVSKERPAANFGEARELAVASSPPRRSYLKFKVPSTPTKAILRLWSRSDSAKPYRVYVTSHRWAENRITYRTAPSLRRLVGVSTAVKARAWTSVDVTDAVRQPGTVSFSATTRSGQVVRFSSQESPRHRPRLVLRQSTQDSADEPVAWAAGDVCDDSDRSPDCSDVGRLIAGDTAADYFLGLGDLQYESGGLADFRRYYDPKMGSGPGLLDKTWPAPGNHEYSSGPAGYFDYFGARAGDPARGYYAQDLGRWRLLVVNTNCTEVGGCSPSSPQGTWLANRLATAPACTVVTGHHPAITDGKYAPGVSEGREIFESAYDGGADLYLAGHDHNYQRFPPLDGNLNSDPEQGVRQFVVGTGGKDLVDFTQAARSQFRQSSSFGALRLTLRTSSYEWQFISISGKVLDSGSGACH